jgi:hypothetical protein
MFSRARFACLLLLLALVPVGAQAAEPRIKRLRTSRDVFTLGDVQLSCDITPLRQEDGNDATSRSVGVRYRFRVLDDASRCRWDSGWIDTLLATRDPWRTSPIPAPCRLDPSVAEIRIEVMAEIAAKACPPLQQRFYRWSDGRFRSQPLRMLWPEHPAEAAALAGNAVVASPVLETPGSPTTAIIIGPAGVSLETPATRSGTRVSWGRLKASYR